jgi:hypothetical protein
MDKPFTHLLLFIAAFEGHFEITVSPNMQTVSLEKNWKDSLIE